MKNTIFTQEQVNEAIEVIIKNPVKQDCKIAHKVVKKAGYELSKYNGKWFVKNVETGKQVSATSGINYSRDYTEHKLVWDISLSGYPDGTHHITRDKLNSVDFVAFLDTPVNEWRREEQHRKWEEWYGDVKDSKSSHSYKRLRDARKAVELHSRQIESSKTEIEELMKEFEQKMKRIQDNSLYHQQRLIVAQTELEQLRKELGLTK